GIRALALLVGALALAARPAAAQDTPFLLELRAGTALPVASFRTGPDRGGEIGRAPTFGAHFVYRGPSGWGPYVGFSQHRFDCAADGCPGDEWVATTWDLGMQRVLGRYAWVRGGGVMGRLGRRRAGGGGGGDRSGVSAGGAARAGRRGAPGAGGPPPRGVAAWRGCWAATAGGGGAG